MKRKILSVFLVIVILSTTILPGCGSIFKPTVNFKNDYLYDLCVGDTIQLEYEIKNGAGIATYVSSNPGVVTISDDGVATCIAEGLAGVNIVVTFDDENEASQTFTSVFNVSSQCIGGNETIYGKNYFKASYETESYVDIGKTIRLLCSYIDANGNELTDISWYSCEKDIATVDENGVVTGVKKGSTEIVATCNTNGETFRFTVTVLPKNVSAGLRAVLDNHVSNANVVYNLNISWNYYYDVVDSVNNMFFDDLKIDYRYHDVLKSGETNDGPIGDVEFITVHYTGNPSNGADADNNADYFNYLGYTASIHFVTGRTNVDTGSYYEDDYLAFAGLNENLAGWHATNSENHEWYASGIRKQANDPETPYVSVSCNGMFTINGRETKVPVTPRSDYLDVLGPTFMYAGGIYRNTFNSMGIATKVKGGEYYIGSTYWNNEYNVLSNTGGNHNSIGIESCVDIGSNLVHTWHVTAELVAKLMLKYDLDISRVVGHHFFSGKNCPQPLLANDQELWRKFIEYVEIEYDKLTRYKQYDFSMRVLDGEGVLDKFGILKQDQDTHCVSYEVNVKLGARTETITLGTIVESNQARPAYASGCESLQQLGYKII